MLGFALLNRFKSDSQSVKDIIKILTAGLPSCRDLFKIFAPSFQF
jgi:hypothetical protein